MCEYNRYEQGIIDFCQQKLNSLIKREYDEYGSFKPTNADKKLDSYLMKMLEDKQAMYYAGIKYIVDIVRGNSEGAKCFSYNEDNIILRLIGLYDDYEETLQEYINEMNHMS